jgi:hypothetical protein
MGWLSPTFYKACANNRTMSAGGTNRTNRASPMMSVVGGKPEVADRGANRRD